MADNHHHSSPIKCPLCATHGGTLVWADDFCRVVGIEEGPDARFPAFLRVIVHRHVAEMSDLSEPESQKLWRVLGQVERTLRSVTLPDKVNLASFGNVVPHLHWHVIPRWRDDSHFPASIWGQKQRPGAPRTLDIGELYDQLRAALNASWPALASSSEELA